MRGAFRSILSVVLVVGCAAAPGARASNVDGVCSDVIDTGSCDARAAGTGANANLKAGYCTAACQADHSKDTAHAHTALWSGTAAVCLAACVPVNPLIAISASACNWTFLGATGAETVLSMVMERDGARNVESLISGAVGIGGSIAAGSLFKDEPELEETATIKRINLGKSVDVASCIRAGLAGIKAGYAIARAGANGGLRDQNLKSARELTSSLSEFAQTDPQASPTPRATATTVAALGSPTPKPSAKTCWERYRAGMHSDPTLCVGEKDELQAAKDAGFRNAFRDASGQDFDDFLKKTMANPPKNVGDAVAGAIGGTPLSASNVASAFNEFTKKYEGDTKLAGETTTGVYAGGGRGAGGSAAGGDGMPDFGALVAGMMGQLAPKPADDAPQGAMNPEFAKLESRSAKELEEDREVSLFTRVAFRYQKSLSRVEPLPFAGKFNQSVRGPASPRK